MARQKIDLPQDQTGHPVQAAGPTGSPANLSAGATTANIALPSNVVGGWIIRIASTEDCYINFGTSGVTATTSSILFPKGVEYLKVPKGATHIAAVRVDTTGIISISNVE